VDTVRGKLIDLNSASERELTQLPRVGVDKARRIVHYRAIRKGFRDWEDFASTLGITEEDVRAIRSRARLEPPPERIGTGRVSRPTGRRPLAVRRPKQFPG
jgi:hypothetical protein